jgi:hypothetical protein
MSSLDKNIFKNKKYSDLLQEIYNNQKKKEVQITALINELKPLVTDIGDATLVVPLIKEYLELGIKNDDALIKVANIYQRIFQTQNSGDDSLGLTEAEREQILKDIKSLPTSNDNKTDDK